MSEDLQKRGKFNSAAYLNYNYLADILHFPLNNPKVLLELHFNQRCAAASWLDHVFNHPHQLFVAWRKLYNAECLNIWDILDRLNVLEKKLTPDTRPLVNQWVLEHLNIFTVVQTVRALELLQQFLASNPCPLDLSAFLSALKDKVSSVQLTDPESFLSLENRKQQLLRFTRDEMRREKKPVHLVIQNFEYMIRHAALNGQSEFEPAQIGQWVLKELKSRRPRNDLDEIETHRENSWSDLFCDTAVVAQLVRALDCGSKCRGFEPRRSPFTFRVQI